MHEVAINSLIHKRLDKNLHWLHRFTFTYLVEFNKHRAYDDRISLI